jgi:hypothetical protein
MPSAWSLDERHPDLRAEGGAVSSVRIKRRISSGGHTALLQGPDIFDPLRPKHSFMADGVRTAFGVKDGEAGFQAFHTPVFVRAGLAKHEAEELLDWLESNDFPSGTTYQGGEGWRVWCCRRPVFQAMR